VPQSQTESFGSVLRRLRLAAGLSLTDLAVQVQYSKGHLSKAENGHVLPSLELVRRLDAVLGAGGTLIQIASPADAATQSGEALLESPAKINPASPPGQAGTSAPAPAGRAPGMDVPSALVPFRGMLEYMRDLGQILGPSRILPMLLPQTRELLEISRRVDPASAAEILLLAARFADYTSWMTQEMGDDITALRWIDRAVTLGQQAGDDDLVAYANVRRANIAMYQQDAYGTISFAQQAQAMKCSARVKSQAAQREAQGHALVGDYEAFRRCICTATDLLEARPDTPGGQPPLGAARIPDPVRLAEGWGLYDLGRSEEAVQILSPLFDSTPSRSGRAWARTGARLAVALASLREIDRACTVIRPILTRISDLESATIRADLRQLARILNRWNANPEVRQIMPVLSAALTPTADLARLTHDYGPEATQRA
jgi:transcriptional regulator with XRE-family HTH domain